MFSLVLVSIEKIYQTLKTVFEPILPTPRSSSKYSAVRRILALFSVFVNVDKHGLSCLIYYMKHSRGMIFVLTRGFK